MKRFSTPCELAGFASITTACGLWFGAGGAFLAGGVSLVVVGLGLAK